MKLTQEKNYYSYQNLPEGQTYIISNVLYKKIDNKQTIILSDNHWEKDIGEVGPVKKNIDVTPVEITEIKYREVNIDE